MPGPLGRGLHQHLGHRGGHGPRRPHRRGPDGGLLRVPGSDGALYRESHRHHGEILRQTPGPALRQRPQKHGEALDSLEIHVACHGGRNNRLDDQLEGPGFPDIDDPVMGPPVRVGRGGGRGARAPRWPCEGLRAALLCRVARFASDSPNSQAPRLVAGDARSQGRLWKSCSFPPPPVPVPHCPHPGTTPHLQSSSPDSWGGRPHSGTARSSRSGRPRQTTR